MAQQNIKQQLAGCLITLFIALAALLLFAAPAHAAEPTELTSAYLDSHAILPAGSYYLSGDVTTSNATISIDDEAGVTIDLRGHTLTVPKMVITARVPLTLTGTGTLAAAVDNYGTLAADAATISGAVNNASLGTIQSGTYTGALTSAGQIEGGTFSGKVENNGYGVISGGTFTASSTVTNHFGIDGGTFHGTLINYGNIGSGAGTFDGAVTNETSGCIFGGAYHQQVKNKGEILAGDFYAGIDNQGGTVDEGAYVTVTFNPQGGSPVTQPQKILRGQQAKMPDDPAKTGYTFLGWYTDEGKQISQADLEKVRYSATYDAHWQAVTYQITYDLDGGEAENPASYTIESDEIKLGAPTKKGYTFTGWTGTGLDKLTKSVTIKAGSTGDRSYIAHWDTDAYEVVFDANGGSVSPEGKSVTYGETYGELPTPTREGYTFKGWFTKPEGGEQIAEDTPVTTTGHQILYAHWTADPAPAPKPTPKPDSGQKGQTVKPATPAEATANAARKNNSARTGDDSAAALWAALAVMACAGFSAVKLANRRKA